MTVYSLALVPSRLSSVLCSVVQWTSHPPLVDHHLVWFLVSARIIHEKAALHTKTLIYYFWKYLSNNEQKRLCNFVDVHVQDELNTSSSDSISGKGSWALATSHSTIAKENTSQAVVTAECRPSAALGQYRISGAVHRTDAGKALLSFWPVNQHRIKSTT